MQGVLQRRLLLCPLLPPPPFTYAPVMLGEPKSSKFMLDCSGKSLRRPANIRQFSLEENLKPVLHRQK